MKASKSRSKRSNAVSVDDYLSKFPADKRQALQSLREILLSAIPDVEEVISYQIPVFKYKGKGLLSMSAHEDHCSLHLMSPPLAKAMADSFQSYKLSGATLQFTPDKPLPVALVKEIVEARLKEVN
ncbi:MAG TPA: DUF1801 domain-containing protein [Anaerolineales bacterium]|nr:DUF1801 domain-containing protein [Anaerolineales bacterium]